MALFYAPNIKQDLTLPEEESQHAVKVLRMEEGDALEVIDGRGGFYNAKIAIAHHKKCKVIIENEIQAYHKRPIHLHIAIAPTKNMERIEWFAEKVTEIGIDEITPIICRFSERKVIKRDRMEKILISAMKQSKKAYLPIINEQMTFSEFMKQERNGDLYIAHCYEQDKKDLCTTYKAKNDVTILIGPEGDFSEEEVELAIKKGYIPVSLGESRLRTETAGVVACHTVNIINQIATANE